MIAHLDVLAHYAPTLVLAFLNITHGLILPDKRTVGIFGLMSNGCFDRGVRMWLNCWRSLGLAVPSLLLFSWRPLLFPGSTVS